MTLRCGWLGTLAGALSIVGISSTLTAQNASPPPSAPAPAPANGGDAKPAEPALKGAAKVRAEAEKLKPLTRSELGRKFLDGAKLLPETKPITLHLNRAERRWLTAEQFAALPDAPKTGFEERALGEDFYYSTRYGSPVTYARALDLIASSGAKPPMLSLSGARVMDFGCGSLGQARMMAASGAKVVGVDVDPMLAALYARPEDQGAMPALDPSTSGHVSLVIGNWPEQAAARDAVGGRFDLIISKNTLKMGYVHPSQDVDKRMLLNLNVSDEEFVKAAFEALAPGGLLVIYNLSPAPAKPGEKYIPWAEGKCPFARELFEKAGFKVLKFDEPDHDAGRAMFEALGYPVKNAAGEDDIFAEYTIVQRP